MLLLFLWDGTYSLTIPSYPDNLRWFEIHICISLPSEVVPGIRTDCTVFRLATVRCGKRRTLQIIMAVMKQTYQSKKSKLPAYSPRICLSRRFLLSCIPLKAFTQNQHIFFLYFLPIFHVFLVFEKNVAFHIFIISLNSTLLNIMTFPRNLLRNTHRVTRFSQRHTCRKNPS